MGAFALQICTFEAFVKLMVFEFCNSASKISLSSRKHSQSAYCVCLSVAPPLRCQVLMFWYYVKSSKGLLSLLFSNIMSFHHFSVLFQGFPVNSCLEQVGIAFDRGTIMWGLGCIALIRWFGSLCLMFQFCNSVANISSALHEALAWRLHVFV